MKTTPFFLALVSAASLFACSSPPKGVSPVYGFNGDRYLGKWYEIARLDHSFERGLSNVTAEYGKVDDETFSVRNRGFKDATGQWETIDGSARFLDDPTVGSLEVKVGAPFYGGYHVIALDKEDYQYALVSGPTRSYLWLLARTPSLDSTIQQKLVDQAKTEGFNTDELIFVKHDRSPES
ncbi:MAG: lipocalin family protein [Verrucomicrobiota bacterium]